MKENSRDKDHRRVDMNENEAITSPIQAARALKAEFESGKGAMYATLPSFVLVAQIRAAKLERLLCAITLRV